jgi:hypothetical protein
LYPFFGDIFSNKYFSKSQLGFEKRTFLKMSKNEKPKKLLNKKSPILVCELNGLKIIFGTKNL